MRTHLALDPRHTALLLVDFQEEQRVVPEYTVAGFADVLANAQNLLQAARNRGLPVIFAAYKRDFDRVPPRPLEQRDAGDKPVFSDKSSPLTEICHELAPRKNEAVLLKNDASAFCEAELDPIMKRAATEWLIVCGVWTEACVAATVRDAIDRGIRVLLVKDACGSGTVAMHQTGILNLANRLYGGAVASTATAGRLIDGETAEVWMPERPVPLLFDYRDAKALFDSL